MPTHRKLVFFIIDGCSWYYLDEIPDLPGLNSVINRGLKAKYAKPVFPSVSLPNYYSMFTGLPVDEHGIVGNHLYDRDWKEKFTITMKESPDHWFQAMPEPLWISSANMGIRTCLYWPWFANLNSVYSAGDKLHYGEDYDLFNDHYEGDKSEFRSWMKSKLVEIVEKLKDPCDQFIMVYWGSLDEMSHNFGPRSPEAIADLILVDGLLVELLEELDRADLSSSVDLLVAADHGQMDAPRENHIYMKDYEEKLKLNGHIEAYCGGEAALQVYTARGRESETYEILKGAKIPHVSVVANDDLPDRYHAKKAKWAPPIWIFPDPGYSIVDDRARSAKHHIGVHGYDNECQSMWGICIGCGPGFDRDHIMSPQTPVSTMDYYTIMCELLGIKPCNIHHNKKAGQ